MKKSTAAILTALIAVVQWPGSNAAFADSAQPQAGLFDGSAPDGPPADFIDNPQTGLSGLRNPVKTVRARAARIREMTEPLPQDAPAPIRILRSSINEDMGGDNFTFVHLTDIHLGQGMEDYGPPGYDDTPPKGDAGGAAKTLRAAVEWINANKDAQRIKFVIVTGDLTESAEKSEFLKAREILDALTVPYVPMLGNHDVWPYVHTSKINYLQTPTPIGDQYFNEFFGGVFRKLAGIFPDWDDGTRLAPARADGLDYESYFQNFAFSYRGYRFLCLDFNSRRPGGFDMNPFAPVHKDTPGVGGEADPRSLNSVTSAFLQSQIGDYPVRGSRRFLLFAHHPLSKLPVNIDFFKTMSFTARQYQRLAKSFKDGDEGAVGAWIAGHLHRNAEYNIKTLGMRSTGVKGIETAAGFNGYMRLITVWGADPGNGL